MSDLLAPAQLLIPEQGVIEGGRLDTWSYTFLRLIVQAGNVFIDVRCTPPGWVFPRDVRLSRNDFGKFRNPGEVAKVIEAQPLIDAALAEQKK